jgi:hypothetical protein
MKLLLSTKKEIGIQKKGEVKRLPWQLIIA